ncbi:MAG: gamma-glutamyltransferase [Opitutaceae bacterium]
MLMTRFIRRASVLLASCALAGTACLRAQGPATEGRRGMVSSASDLASGIGVDILQRGGNAVDAAVAVALALAVTYPQAGNLGGGGFMLIRMADGTTTLIDYRETAPAAATRGMYLNPKGEYIPGSSLAGWRASGVPGTVAGLALALEKHGTLPWSIVVEPARILASKGFDVSQALANSLREEAGLLGKFPASRSIFLRDGDPYEKGERIIQEDLGETFARLQFGGPREFYEGETADFIAAAMEKNGGLITLEDLKNYKPAMRAALRGKYRDLEILTMPPPSSGGIALLQMLNMLEPFDLRAMGFHSSESLHLMTEVMRLAFRDRAEYLGDPDFVKVPVEGLVSKDYAARLMKDFDPRHAKSSVDLPPGNPPGHESSDTTHFSIVDTERNAVSNTYTLNGAYGSGVTVPETGILLNNEMDDFTSKPGVPNQFGLIQGEANAIEPGKRPLSSMTPTIALRDGELFLVAGSPGGPTIITTVLQVILNIVDYGMPLQLAVEATRVHHQWMPDALRVEPFALPADVQRALEARGHELDLRESHWGGAEAILVDRESDLLLGASDPRNPDGAAFGY